MRRILAITDSALLTRSFRRGLWRYRDAYSVDAAEGEAAGLARLRARTFDAVVVDLSSTERAIGVLRRARDLRPGCLRIAFAPRADHPGLLFDHDLVAQCFSKPALPSEIVAALERCLGAGSTGARQRPRVAGSVT